jgi:hypothetical protein
MNWEQNQYASQKKSPCPNFWQHISIICQQTDGYTEAQTAKDMQGNQKLAGPPTDPGGLELDNSQNADYQECDGKGRENILHRFYLAGVAS